MFSFVKNRKLAYIIATFFFIASLLSPFILPVYQWIDLTGGIQIEYSVEGKDVMSVVQEVKETSAKNAKNQLPETDRDIVTDILVYNVTGTQNFVVEAWIDETKSKNDNGSINLDRIDATKNQFIENLRNEYATISDANISQVKYVNIGASFGKYIKNSGYLTLTLAVIGISVYIMYAFSGTIAGMISWPFALVTGVTMLHDVVVSFGLYIVTSAIFPEFKIDTFLFTAMLTVLWYSINDTIVILDKVRSTLKTEKNMPFEKIIDNAVHATMRRSIFTSLTIFIVLIAMFLFGPDAISGFVLILMFGVIVGTLSSVFLAAPALVDIITKEQLMAAKKPKENLKDEIIL